MDQKGKKKSKAKTSNNSKKIVKLLWTIFLGGLTLIIGVFTCISLGWIGYMPPIEDLENPIDKYASQVYSSDNDLIGTYSLSKENRIQSTYDELSPYLVQALVATEDARYYSHSGIDVEALGRVAVKTVILFQKNAGGGSTISQQLAKQLFSPRADSFMERILQKPIEWVIAVKLEKNYTKDEIVNLYLNQFDFLNNAVGIQSASKVYFNKLPKDLTIEEAATLIGMCKNPSIFNPRRFPERTQGRRDVVLEQMYKANYLTKAEMDSLKQIPLKLDFRRVDHKDGLAPYFREYLRLIMTAKKPKESNYAAWQKQQYVQDSVSWETNPLYGWCNKNVRADGSHYNLYSDGLKIYATINAKMQEYAENAVAEHMSKSVQPAFDREKKGRATAPFSVSGLRDAKTTADSLIYRAMKQTDRYRKAKQAGASDKEIYQEFKRPVEMKVFAWRGDIDTTMTPWDSIRYHKSFMRAGFMAMDPLNGQVKAYVGGIDFKFFQYDMVNAGRRQIGSTIKPYLYASAMIEGMTPCDQMLLEQQVLIAESGEEWRPRKGNSMRIGEIVTIKWGLQNSDNWVTAYLMKRTSPYTFVRLLHSFGITGKIDPVVSIALGACEVSVAEMTGAYTAFANKGIRAVPMYVTRIEDSFGNVVATFNPDMREVFSELTYLKMLDMLRAVVDGGTGGRLRRIYGLRAPLGGKTGTTQSNSDGWFMGFAPRLVAGTWVGGEDRAVRFDNTAVGQGASMALPIFGMFMQKVYADPKLGYSQNEMFPVVPGNPCENSMSDYDDAGATSEPQGVDENFF